MKVATRSICHNRIVSAAAAVTLCDGIVNRDSLIISNDMGTLFVKLGLGASPSNYTYRLNSYAVLEIGAYWKSHVSAIKASGTGIVRVTETE